MEGEGFSVRTCLQSATVRRLSVPSDSLSGSDLLFPRLSCSSNDEERVYSESYQTPPSATDSPDPPSCSSDDILPGDPHLSLGIDPSFSIVSIVIVTLCQDLQLSR